MEFKILKQEKNALLHREEYLIEVNSDSNPSFGDVKYFLKKDEKILVIRDIKGNFGSNTFRSEAFVYESQKYKDEIEVIPKKVRKKLEEEAKKKAEEEAKKKAEEEKAEEEKAKEQKSEDNKEESQLNPEGDNGN